jgi:hypothetical protein
MVLSPYKYKSVFGMSPAGWTCASLAHEWLDFIQIWYLKVYPPLVPKTGGHWMSPIIIKKKKGYDKCINMPQQLVLNFSNTERLST